MLTILLVKCREVYRKMEEYDRLFTKGRVYKSDNGKDISSKLHKGKR